MQLKSCFTLLKKALKILIERNLMFFERLSHELYRTVHGGRFTVREISEATGIPENTLYRSAQGFLPNGSGISPSLKNVILIMKATRDYRTLRFIANWFGFLLVRHPRCRRNLESNQMRVTQLQGYHLAAAESLLAYESAPNMKNLKLAISALYLSMEYQAGIIKGLKHAHQLEFQF